MSKKKKRRRRRITPWKITAFKVCIFWLLLAAGIHFFRIVKAATFQDQGEASRWGSEMASAQVSAFLPVGSAMKQEEIRELEYKINTALAQDSIKLTSETPGARLWQDCYSATGSLNITAGRKTVTVDAVGTGGAFFTFHPLRMTEGAAYLPDSLMKDEILLDEETAWKLFGAFDVIGRTVQVQDMHLRITGIFKKQQGGLYEKSGMPTNLVFVQYKTLVQYGNDSAVPGTQEQETGSSRTSTDPAQTDEPVGDDASADDSPVDNASASDHSAGDTDASDASADNASGSGDSSGSASETVDVSAGDTSSGSENDTKGGNEADGSGDSQNVGKANTSFKDTGRITVYEIVMPNPVEGYAAAVLERSLGEDIGAIVVDNTNRYGFRSLLTDLRDFAFLGMRMQSVRYPYWENVAIGWETIFAALLLLEFVLIIFTILLLLWMLIHWYTHKPWTVMGNIRNLQENMYERQSRKRYPEYYRQLEEEESEEKEDEPDREKQAEKPDRQEQADQNKGQPALIEEKERIPFEKISENRKVVQHETIQEDDLHNDSSSSGPEHRSMWRW